ncbi:CBS domain-containing protein [Vreelandella rituensis]|uniref:CBS domain-containing protein n=1 Tax=Vreelandella rituensis TaxID=2282306 RepID=A0A368TX87_9GAMM|nr:CBS domain-containing protein [Halomonas rituensis]RCV89330.1 CBS domain-containing protein [Halomonas rituensis]
MSATHIIRVSDIMHNHFCLVDGFTTVSDATHLMRQEKARALLIRKRHDDDEYGIVLPSDIAKAVLATGRSSQRINVYEIMSKPVIGVRPDMQVRYCARLFEQFGLAVAPVIDSAQQVIGLIDYDHLVLQGLDP